MATKVIMPKQGLQMTEGTILKWLVPEGGDIKEGEPLFEMETDKLTITMDSPGTGKLLKIVRGEGEVVEITKLIGVIGNDGEDISAILAESGAAPAAAPAPAAEAPAAAPAAAPAPAAPTAPAVRAAGEKVYASPRARELAKVKGYDLAAIPGSGPEGFIIERDVMNFVPAAEVKATPLAKKVAELEGVDLKEAAGTGAHGKIVKNDILALAEQRASMKAAAAAGIEMPVRGEHLVKATGMRKAVARNMKASQNANAQTTHHVEVDMTNAVSMRETYKSVGKKISYNDIVLRAVARALTEFPMMNASWTDEGILVKEYVNLGVAVALDEGLIVPNIKNADCMSIEEISAMAKELAAKAKEGKLMMEEYNGGTFTVSNLGMFGLDDFVAIINPPEAGIIAVGKMEKKAVVRNDEIVIRPMMSLVLSYDHRVVDGAPAAQFIMRVKQLMENPCLML
ncbi:MAG: 2-oxo acid dehydrogenase subunit E2 [Christensenellaceae bacterium]|nr:2-oxo acid dehydrogenase subunit E2 [Christensenellaceae bacterium]